MLGTNKQLGGSVAAETSACDHFIPCLARPEEEKGTYGKRTSGLSTVYNMEGPGGVVISPLSNI